MRLERERFLGAGGWPDRPGLTLWLTHDNNEKLRVGLPELYCNL
jgi:hypothetical protein